MEQKSLAGKQVQEGALLDEHGGPFADSMRLMESTDISIVLDFRNFQTKCCQVRPCPLFIEADGPPRLCRLHWQEALALDPDFMPKVRLAQKLWSEWAAR